MIAFAEKVVAYTNGLDQQAFVVSGLVYDATLRNLELIGEAARLVPDEVRSAHLQVPWRLVVPRASGSSTATLASTTTRCGASSCRMFRPCCPRCEQSRMRRHEQHRRRLEALGPWSPVTSAQSPRDAGRQWRERRRDALNSAS